MADDLEKIIRAQNNLDDAATDELDERVKANEALSEGEGEIGLAEQEALDDEAVKEAEDKAHGKHN